MAEDVFEDSLGSHLCWDTRYLGSKLVVSNVTQARIYIETVSW